MRKNLTREHGNHDWDIQTLRAALAKELYEQEAGYDHFNSPNMLNQTASYHTATVTKSNNSSSNEQKGHQKKRSNGNSNVKSCVFCTEYHSPFDCTNVSDKENWYDIIKQKRLCFNCFGSHKVSECHSKYKCRKCDKKHHTTLCDKDKPKRTPEMSRNNATVNAVELEENQDTSAMYTSSSSTITTRTDVLLITAVAPVWSENKLATANILLDEGSQRSFISQELAEMLQLRPSGSTTISLAAFGDKKRNVRNLDKAVIELETKSKQRIRMEILIVPTIAAPLQHRISHEVTNLSYLQGLTLAHL